MNGLSFTVRTKGREELVNITSEIRKAIENSGIVSGICVVYVPHTTAAITINEAADPDVVRDIISRLRAIIPIRGDYAHSEGNSDAHIKSALIGNSRILIVDNRKPLLGRWEGVFLCEFDGPRTRSVFVKVL